MTDDNSHVLKPTKMATSTTNKLPTDKFGQNYKSDDDSSKWSTEGPALSRKSHSRSDVDLSSRSLHHTLGIKHSQASPGDHIHDGIMSRKIGVSQLLPGGITEPAWSLPASYGLVDVVNLLKNFVDFKLVTTGPGQQDGTINISFTTLTSFTTVITFPQAYPAGVIPKVFTNINSGDGETGRWGSRAISISNTQFTLFLYRGVATDAAQTWVNIPVQWFSTN